MDHLDTIRRQLEAVLRETTATIDTHRAMERERKREMEERERMTAEALEQASQGEAVRLAEMATRCEERRRFLALIDERLTYFEPHSHIGQVLRTLRLAVEGG